MNYIIYLFLGGILIMLGIIAYRLKPSEAKPEPIVGHIIEEKAEPSIEWRNVVLSGEKSIYEVSEMGEVRNKDTHSLLSTSVLSSGYVVVTLFRNGKHSQYSVAQLVAKAFLGDGNGRVIHINGDLSDNRASNLAWEREAFGVDFKPNSERWRTIYVNGINTGYKVSNKGNFKKPDGGLISSITIEGYTGERRIMLKVGDKRKQIYASKLVASAFIDNPNGYNYVCHIDGDVLNNNADNLKWQYSSLRKG